MLYVYVFLSTATAWALISVLERMNVSQIAMNSVIAGAFCTLLALLLPLTGISFSMTAPALILLPFLLPLQNRPDIKRRLLNLCLSLGAWSLLDFSGMAFQSCFSPIPALICFVLFVIVSVLLAWLLRKRFPEEIWNDDGNGTEKRSVRSIYLWIILAMTAILELSLRYLIGIPSKWSAAFALVLGYAVLFWGAVCAICLITDLRQERLSTLIDQNYRNEMQSYMSVIRSQRHDYNFHVQALAGLIHEGNMEECQKYVDNLVRDSAAMNTYLPVKDPAIGALIFSFRTMAMEYGIELHPDIQYDMSSVVTNVYETNKVIGNLLQNAIDEVRTHKDKSFGIHLFILKRGENCVVHVANKVIPKNDPNTFMDEIYHPGHSTKEGHEGIGLNSIQNLLRPHRGVLYSRMEGDVIHFIAKIPIEMQGEQA